MTDEPGPDREPAAEAPKKPRRRRAATVKPIIEAAEQSARPTSFQRTAETAAELAAKGAFGLGMNRLATRINEIQAGALGSTAFGASLGTYGEELAKRLRANDDRYSGLITQAAGTATTAHEHAIPREPIKLGPTPESRQAAALEAVERHIVRVAETVATMADTIQPMLEVARDANDALLRLEATAAATIDATTASAVSADKAAGSLVTLTRVLTVTTIVIAILTIVLVVRGR